MLLVSSDLHMTESKTHVAYFDVSLVVYIYIKKQTNKLKNKQTNKQKAKQITKAKNKNKKQKNKNKNKTKKQNKTKRNKNKQKNPNIKCLPFLDYRELISKMHNVNNLYGQIISLNFDCNDNGRG